MLLNVPRILTPELLMALDMMGHGDEIVIADSNFPALSMARDTVYGKPLYVKGSGVVDMLDAVLAMIPLDYLVNESVIGVSAPPERGSIPIHDEFPEVMRRHGYAADRLKMVSKADFYARAKNAALVIVTGEASKFANLIVRKGVI